MNEQNYQKNIVSGYGVSTEKETPEFIGGVLRGYHKAAEMKQRITDERWLRFAGRIYQPKAYTEAQKAEDMRGFLAGYAVFYESRKK